jgi:hypothetical protein
MPDGVKLGAANAGAGAAGGATTGAGTGACALENPANADAIPTINIEKILTNIDFSLIAVIGLLQLSISIADVLHTCISKNKMAPNRSHFGPYSLQLRVFNFLA